MPKEGPNLKFLQTVLALGGWAVTSGSEWYGQSLMVFFFFFLANSMWDVSSTLGIEPLHPLHWKQSPNGWTSREVPVVLVFIVCLSSSILGVYYVTGTFKH